MKRKRIDHLGRKRKPDYVVWFREPVRGVSKIRVQWKPLGETTPKTESFPDTAKGLKEARSFAEGVHEELQQRRPEAPSSISLRALLERHIAAKTTGWAPNTLRLLKWRWGKLELYVGRSTAAHLVTREHLDGLRNELLKRHAPNQVRLAVKAVTSVFRWGVDRDLIAPTKVTNYTVGKFAKEYGLKAPKMAEYSADERRRLIAQFDPKDPRQWRPYVAEVLLGYLGNRADATLAIAFTDVDFDRKQLRWDPANDKMGREREQPMPPTVVDALWVAYGWRLAYGYEGKYVFFRPGAGTIDRGSAWKGKGSSSARARRRAEAKPDKPWTYAAFIEQHHEAEKRAGIKHIKYRGAHGHRRGVAGDIHEKTGSSKKAADFIGDKSTRIVETHYLLSRGEQLQESTDLISEAMEEK